MKEIKLQDLDQSIYFKKLNNGLEVYFIPYKNKSNYSMHYITKFGSRNTAFKPVGSKKMITVPDGIAHFLEHKMFEQPNGTNSLDTLMALGIDANAYTTNDHTAYLFECTNN